MASARKLEDFCNRPLDGYDIVAVFIYGKTFAKDEMVVALGVDIKGKKAPLGFIQTATENAKAALEHVAKELRLVNESALTSLNKGLEETLPLLRLALKRELKIEDGKTAERAVA